MTPHEQLLKDMAYAACIADDHDPDNYHLWGDPNVKNWQAYLDSMKAALVVVRDVLATVTPKQQQTAIGFLNRSDQMLAVAAFGDLLESSAITPDKPEDAV